GPAARRTPFRRPAGKDLVGRWLQRHRRLGGKAGGEPAKLNPQGGGNRRAFPRPAGRSDPGRAAWKEASHAREPRVSVSRSIFALLDDRDRAYFGRGGEEKDQVGFIDEKTRAIFGRSYVAEPDVLVEQLKTDEAIAEADTLLLTVPNQLGVAYNAHIIEAILPMSPRRSAGADLARQHFTRR